MTLALFPALALAAPNTLVSTAVGNGSDYTRLAFTFQEPLAAYEVRRDDANRLVVDFGPAEIARDAELPPHDLIRAVEYKTADGRLTATVSLSTMRYELRHFLSRDKYSCVLDFKALEAAPGAAAAGDDTPPPLKIPSLEAVAAQLARQTPPQPGDTSPENLYQRFLGQLQAGNYPAAREDGRLYLGRYSDRASAEPVSYLMAELDFFSGAPNDTYAQATEDWKTALGTWPQSPLAIRAQFMLAEADRLSGQNNEAAAKFKILTDEALHTDYVYPQLAVLRAVDLLMGLGLIDEARAVLDPVVKEGVADRLGLEAYARVGLADFYQGFFSQANEIFREALRLAPTLYQTFPEMLYAAGEGYHYLNRPDLSRLFLLHALNLMPEHPKADVMMARIGDDYRKEGRDREAMAVYGVAKRRYPTGDGGLISQVRLADMGALHSFFTQDKVFDALELGSRQATVEMYKTIVEDAGAPSPLTQLAQLKIGAALAEEGANSEAIRWLRDIEINNPKSSLLPEVLPALNRAIVRDVMMRRDLGDWQGITDLYADNSSYLSDTDRPLVQREVAQAYEKLGRFAEAREVWQELEEQSPEKRLARLRGLVENSLRINRPLDAVDYLAQMEREFPQEGEWIREQLTALGGSLAAPKNAEATNNLMHLATATRLEPIRKNALADAIEIEINDQRYDKASALMDQFRREYPSDPLTPEYLLTQAQIEDYSKRYEQAWDKLAEFRLSNPQDPRGPELLAGQIARAEELSRPDDAFRFMDLYQASYPDTPEGRAMLVRRLDKEWNLGRQADARDTLAAFRRAYPGDPAIPGLIERQSDRDWEAGNFEEAQQALDDLLLNYPERQETIDFLARRAEREWERERYDEAGQRADDLRRYYPQAPQTRDLLLKLALDDWERERYPESQKWVEELRRSFPGEPQTGDLMLKLASADWDRGRFAEARRGWDDFRSAYPQDPRVGRSYVEQYRKMAAGGFGDEAFQLADTALNSLAPADPARADLLLEEAKDYLAAGRADEGLGKWTQFREQFPEDARTPDVLLIQARQEMKLGRRNEALEHYRQFLANYPDHDQSPDVYLETAATEIALSQPQNAWEHLDQYRQLFPRHPGRPKALLDQADLGRELGHNAEAVELYKIFRQDYPQAPQAAGTILPQARLEAAAGAPETAAQTLEAGLAAYPALADDPQVVNRLADLYLETGQVEKWAARVEDTLNRAPNPQADLANRFLKYNQLALVYVELGQAEAAERNFDAALANRPPDASPDALYAIAGAYKKLQRPEKYAQTLAVLRDSGNDFWKKIAEGELAALGPVGDIPPQTAPQTPPAS